MTLPQESSRKLCFANIVIRSREHFEFLFERDAKQDEAEKARKLKLH